MPLPLATILLVFAFVLFLLAAFFTPARVNLQALGLACVAAALLVGG